MFTLKKRNPEKYAVVWSSQRSQNNKYVFSPGQNKRGRCRWNL